MVSAHEAAIALENEASLYGFGHTIYLLTADFDDPPVSIACRDNWDTVTATARAFNFMLTYFGSNEMTPDLLSCADASMQSGIPTGRLSNKE